MRKTIGVTLALFCLALPALAQQEATEPPIAAQKRETLAGTPDWPAGAPYNVGRPSAGGETTAVPLRDFLSSRQDQARVEVLNMIERLERQLLKIMDERDRQYAQRFDAQQEAVSSALQATKESAAKELLATREAAANALQAAEKAVTKSEAAADKRFDSQNEFRAQLDDQADTFVTKDAAAASFKSLEDKVIALSSSFAATTSGIVADVNRNSSRLDSIQAVREDNKDTSGYWIAAVGILIGAGGLVLALRKQQGAHA